MGREAKTTVPILSAEGLAKRFPIRKGPLRRTVAEVHAVDGSSAVVQVRQSLDDAAGPGGVLRAGAAALIYDYDDGGEFFWVMPAPSPTG